MRKLILSMHVTLDGFVAGPKGEMNWIKLDEGLFDYVNRLTEEADMALYGRNTYGMMQSYWPTAADKPNATKHDIEHSRWYNSVIKVVISKSMQAEGLDNTIVIHDHIPEAINNLKQQPGKNIQIFGSPGAVHALMQHNLIDAYWLFLNPVVIGEGIPLFDVNSKLDLKLVEAKALNLGVVLLHYETKRD